MDRTILFADIVSSTALYEKLGNLVAKERVGGCLDSLTATVKSHGGEVVKSLGDGILCCFTNTQSAILAGFAMFERAQACGLELRIGVHRGPVLEDHGDVFGDAVNTASRIADLAKPQELLVSKSSKETLPSELGRLLRSVPAVTLKGKMDPVDLFAIVQEDLVGGDDLSQTMCVAQHTVQIGRRRTGDRELELTYAGSVLSLVAEMELTIGRDAYSGLTVEHKEASRAHARVFHRQGKFVLVDQSTNGTFLVPAGQRKVHLLREQAILHGIGEIYPGVDPDATTCAPIHYRVS